MKVTDNRPLPDKQPFHRDLDVEVWMSEPDFRIGVDEELVSSLEALHEDLYFVTLASSMRSAARPPGGGWRRPARSFRSFIRIGPASPARSGCTTPATRRRSRRSRSPTKRRRRTSDARLSRPGEDRDHGCRGRARRGARGPVSELSLDVEAKDDARPRGRLTRWTRCRACTPPACTATRCRSITSIAWR